MRLITIMLAIILTACAQKLATSDGTDPVVQLTVTKYDEKKAAPTVLIGHGSGGVAANHHAWASEVNSWGYNAVIIDHYSLRGIGIHTGRPVAGATTTDRARDFSNVVAWVVKQPWHSGKVALMGFSQGGGGVLAYVNSDAMKRLNLLSANEPIAAAVGFYPSCGFQPPPKEPRMPVLMLLAEKDDLADPSFCNPISNPITSPLYEVHILKDATHSFDENIPSGVRLIFTHRYNSKAIAQSKAITKEFLAKYLN